MEHHLLIDSVEKHFDSKVILSDIFLEINSGEIISIHGRNGSGKTTLFNIIYGIEPANHRFIKYNNNKISKAYRIKNLISYSTQKCFLPKNLVVHEIISLFVKDESSLDLLAFFKPILYTKIINLSSGEKNMLQTCLILNSQAKFVLLDEAFSKLSPLMIEKLSEIIIEKSKTKGILICDHNYEQLFKISHKNYFLKNGALKKMNSSSEFFEMQNLL